MENSANVSTASEVSSANESKSEIIVEIDLNNLSSKQKSLLLAIFSSFVVQIIYLFNIQLLANIFKTAIAESYKIVADYVVQFLNTFIPYLIVIFFVFEIYISYIILLDDETYLKIGSQIFDFSVIALLTDLVLFSISLMTKSNVPLDPTYPNLIELFIFLFMIILSISISLTPFYFINQPTKIDKKTLDATTESASLNN